MSERAPVEIFIPDLCGVRALFGVLVIGELLVLILMLTRVGVGPAALDELALLTLYVQGIGLTAAAALCLSRPWLCHLPEHWVAVLSYLLVLTVVAMVGEFAWRVVNPVVSDGTMIGLSHGDFTLRTMGITAITAALILRYFYVQFHWQQRTVSEAQAHVQALQARIRPHFLFNCMNTIASLTRTDPARAERAVEDLADLFRASLSDARGLVTLADELELARRYLQIEALRLGSRLTVTWATEELPLDTLIPQLTLQPLLENAIYHGIEPLPAGGLIAISGRATEALVEIAIRNPMSTQQSTHVGNHLAQDNIRQRLTAHFGSAGQILITTHDLLYEVRIQLPRHMKRLL
jgi:two-component system, LytTR family, sensor histidine kinase AlgZ